MRTCARWIGLWLTVGVALAVVAPRGASASSLITAFKTSTTGNATVFFGDTIQFEVTIILDVGATYDTVFFELTGDVRGALGSSSGSGWAGVDNVVTDWEWAYFLGTGQVDMGTNGRFAPFTPPAAPPNSVTGPYGYLATGNKTGDGVPALLGTVTIANNAPGTFQAGAFLYPTIDGFLTLGVEDTVDVTTASFSHVPEPATGLLVGVGLAAFACRSRRTN